MKAIHFHEMNTVELQDKLKDMKSELFNLRFQHATGQLTNPLSINLIKKDIARAITILKERENGKQQKSAAAAATAPKKAKA